MKIKFLADADLSRAIVNGVLRCEPAVDFLSAGAARLRGKPDPEVLAIAAQAGRILVSHDVGTMPAHFRRFQQSGRTSAGVFLVSQKVSIAAAIDDLISIWLASDAEEWRGRLEWLPL